MLAQTRDVVTYRDLLRNLVVRDLKVRYRGSFIGFLWSLLNPLLMMGVYWFVFTKLLKSDKPEFHIFVFVALLPWNWCASSVLGGMTSIVGNAHLIKKVYFPRELLPLSVVISNGINFLLALPVLFLLIALASNGPDLRTLAGHSAPVASVVYAPDGGSFASGSDDHTVRIWRAPDGALLHTLGDYTAPVASVAFAPDASILAVGRDDHTVRLWRVSDGSPVQALMGTTAKVNSVGFAPNGLTLAAGAQDGSIRLWHRNPTGWNSPTVQTLVAAGPAVWSVAFQPAGGAILAAAGDDRTVRLWRISDGSLVRTLTGPRQPVVSMAWAPDGQTLAAGATDGVVRLWHVSDGSLLRTLAGPAGTVYSLAFAPDGQTLVTGGADSMVRTWRVADGSLIRTFEGHTAKVNSVAFAPDGSQIVSGSDDVAVRTWAPGGPTTMHLSPYISWLPLLILTQAVFLAGVSFFFAALNVFFRDTQAIMDVGIQAWFFLTPVIYSAEDVLPTYTNVMYWLNPMASVISNYRDILYKNGLTTGGLGPDVAFMLRTLLTSLVVLIAGYLFFRSLSRRFGEEL